MIAMEDFNFIQDEDKESVETYVESVYSRSEKFIDVGIWHGIDKVNLRAWRNNFTTVDERYFSALVLDNLTYRTEDHVKSMLIDLFTIGIPNAFRLNDDEMYKTIRYSLLLFKNRKDIPVRIVNTNHAPTQSSGYYVFMLNHVMGFHRDYFCKLDEIEAHYDKGIKHFILIDDIICSGEQIDTVLKLIDIQKYKDVAFYIAACAIHDDGMKLLGEKYPHVKYAYAEHLTQNVSFLDGVDYSYPVVCTRDILDRFYKKMLKEKGFEARKPYGIIGMGLNYAFDKSVPNDCIAVLHLHNEQFNGLLKKRGS